MNARQLAIKQLNEVCEKLNDIEDGVSDFDEQLYSSDDLLKDVGMVGDIVREVLDQLTHSMCRENRYLYAAEEIAGE